MSAQQAALFAILVSVMGLLVWGRWRYDVVAFGALLAAAVTGIVPAHEAFLGFGHPATVVIAMVLIVSRGLSNSGLVDILVRAVTGWGRSLLGHVGVMAGLAGVLSAFMNNVGALALLMPVDLEAARKAKRPASLTLMPLSFASILGGLVTLIGTPPNIIIAAFREDALGAPYRMFDFTPVGASCAAVGIAFVVLVGWRLIPSGRAGATDLQGFELDNYVAEARVKEGSELVGRRVRDLDDLAQEHEIQILGLVRRGKRLPGMARVAEIRKNDLLVIEGGPDDLTKAMAALDLTYAAEGDGRSDGPFAGEDVSVVEVVVPQDSRVAGRTSADLRLRSRFGVLLLGVSRRGTRLRERLNRLTIQPGDVLLLQGGVEELPEAVRRLGCLPLADRGVPAGQRRGAVLCGGIFAAAILLAGVGALDLPVALAGAAGAMVALRFVPLREIYTTVEWPVIVLIGSMIPIGTALETTGATETIAGGILAATAGFSPIVVLVLLMVVTMTLSDVMNNTATAVIAAPIAVEIARRLDVDADPFLMAVAVAASCAFLTPIGHKNNTLILGPGGYRFGDYWRLGLPLEILIIAVGVPMILLVWPL